MKKWLLAGMASLVAVSALATPVFAHGHHAQAFCGHGAYCYSSAHDGGHCYTDADRDGVCDYFVDEDADGICDYCAGQSYECTGRGWHQGTTGGHCYFR